ncbi:regulatory protein YcgZ [Erwinia sp. MMLR14_017]|uniref:regulatory protein YcgZ n=1 Tax=Erwinia sp. MMLR14_017 TaxID=3093842 RepID=UPI00298FB29C|nr:regulatory protein YcgZ [Erwinia sp. MMLR14_017]MDW8844966.1 regulatory protein YcgZ [Erwinia sp. MMLR14_017]
MHQNNLVPQTEEQIAHYFNTIHLPTQQETLGQIVTEILRAGKSLNRKAICSRLLFRLEHASGQEEERHYQQLIGLLFARDI